MIPAGMYTVVYPDGQYRTMRVKYGKDSMAGKVLIGYKDANATYGWQYFGFLTDSGVAFWRKFAAMQPDDRLYRIKRAVNTVLTQPQVCGLAYAQREGRCCRCGLTLTVPASLHAGLGPDCAGKGHWTVADNQAAYTDTVGNKW